MAVNVWRNFISKPRLNNYVSTIGEVGYCHYGSTFAIAGTLHALNTIVLIDYICVEILTPQNKSAHFMDWFAFRPTQHIMGNFSEIDLTMTSKFTITPENKFDYNILFIDNNHFSQMKTLLEAVKNAWAEYLVVAGKEKRFVDSRTLFPEFNKLELIANATKRLKSLAYWQQGQYSIKIRLVTKNPKQTFTIKKYFFLTQPEAQMLEDNAEKIIANICQQPQEPYSCATPSLLDKK